MLIFASAAQVDGVPRAQIKPSTHPGPCLCQVATDVDFCGAIGPGLGPGGVGIPAERIPMPQVQVGPRFCSISSA